MSINCTRTHVCLSVCLSVYLRCTSRYINGSVHDHESRNGAVCGASTCSTTPGKEGCTDPDCESAQWTGPTWPVGDCGIAGGVCPHVCNVSFSNCTRNTPCSAGGCLFDLGADPSERRDLSLQKPAMLAQMQQALRAAVANRFQTTNSSYSYSGCAASWTANVAAHGGFAAPMCTQAIPPTEF